MLTTAIAGGLASTAGAVRAQVLGKSSSNPAPACPDNPRTGRNECQITGQVTGFQRSINGKANVFKPRKTSKIVAWSVNLSRPSKEERETFGEAARTEEFGTNPTAGISVIRKDGRARFKLIRSSPIMELQRHYGTKPVFTLRQPLHIRRGDIVALTTATWLPAFAFRGVRDNNVWVGSRARKNCELPSPPPDDPLAWFFAHTRPHRDVGSTRVYGCAYSGARLLYQAHYVPKRG